ncbi:helix-turn-helix domain-containing protein [Novispirillum itersonii]|uniref:helix-turn-helix domain-containing protein n=1 Tax=Novispirillum itersonii TaxID=189 RepID=UPI0012DD318A
MAIKSWDKAGIKAAVIARGLTLRGVSLAAGLPRDAASQALHRPWAAAEAAIAAAIGEAPATLWPDRYDPHGDGDGTPPDTPRRRRRRPCTTNV